MNLNNQKSFSIKENNQINLNNNNINQNSNQYVFKGAKSLNKQNKIKHSYKDPLTLIKLKRYKMITEKDKFSEDKERYEINKKIKYHIRGLNQFGYPLNYNKRMFRQYNTQTENKNLVNNMKIF